VTGRPRLRLADPAIVPDTRAAVARALLTRYAPTEPVIEDTTYAFLGWKHQALADLERNPRYLIGRLTQVLTQLLEEETPPLDATEQLLSDAIRDAARYRLDRAHLCCPDGCDRCEPDCLRAEQYQSLWGQLGLVDELPKPPAGLRMAGGQP
jgi:hypothetical protein